MFAGCAPNILLECVWTILNPKNQYLFHKTECQENQENFLNMANQNKRMMLATCFLVGRVI